MLTFNILFDEVDRGPGHEKKIFFLTYHLNGISISLFLEYCYPWHKLICREYTVEKKVTMFKKDD